MRIEDLLKYESGEKSPLTEAFDYDKEGPKSDTPLEGPHLEPKARQCIQDLYNGATKEWVYVHHGISPDQLRGYIYTARLAGYDFKLRQWEQPIPDHKNKTKLIRDALLKNWDVSLDELKTLTRSQNANTLGVLRANIKKKLRKKFPDRWPAPPQGPTMTEIIRNELLKNWYVSMDEIVKLTKISDRERLGRIVSSQRAKLRKKYPGKWPEADKSGRRLSVMVAK
jgi:hypothetical protein